MTEQDAIWDYHDGQQAQRLVEVLRLDGWLVEWERVVDCGWEARLSGPSLPGRVVGRSRSRVSAISQAHVAAIRRLRLGDVPRIREAAAPANQCHGPDIGEGIVSLAPTRAELAPSS